MKKWLQRIRGAVGVGLTWAVGWGVVGGLLGLFFLALGSGPAIALALFTDSALAGFLLGGCFSVVLALEGRGRAFDEISLLRFTTWGAFGGLLLWAPMALGLLGAAGWSVGLELLVTASVMAGLGAGSAAGSLVLARRGDDGELLSASADVENIGLSKEEKRELLGT